MRAPAVELLGRVAACLICVSCATVTVDTPTPLSPTATPFVQPSALPSSPPTPPVVPSPTVTPAGHSTDPSTVLLRMADHRDCTAQSRACLPFVVFALYGDGRAVYRTSLTDATADVRVVQLDEPAIDEILAFSIDDGGLRDTPGGFTSLNATPYVSFEVRSRTLTDVVGIGEPLSKLVKTSVPTNERVGALARRLADFDREVGDRASPVGACAVSPRGTIPPNDIVVWDQPIWQTVMTDVWAAPLGAMESWQTAFKVLWWVPDGHGHPLDIRIALIPDGIGADLAVDVVLAAEEAFPNRPDRPSGIPSLPPGCYRFSVSLGSDSGSIIEQVVL